MIPYSKSELNFRRNLPSETYHLNFFFRLFNIVMFFQDKNVFATKFNKFSKIFRNLPSETYQPKFCETG